MTKPPVQTGGLNPSAEVEIERPSARPSGEREMTSVERAAARALELMDSGTLDVDTTDKFYFDRSLIPEGWSYEWKRRTVYNQEDPAYQVELARMGWEPVPAKRHPEMMPVNYKGETIERDGQILMERPEIVTKKIMARDRRAALEQVQVSEKKLEEAPPNQFERSHQRESMVRVKHAMEPIEIADE